MTTVSISLKSPTAVQLFSLGERDLPLLGAVVFLQPLVQTELVERRLHFAHAGIFQLDLSDRTRLRDYFYQTFIETS